MKRILILGSTGSIGLQALEVVSGNPELEVAGLAAAVNHKMLARQAREFGVRDIAIVDEFGGSRLAGALPHVRVFDGPGCIRCLIEAVDSDLVLNAVVGAAGLEATVATLEKGVDLALANKESLVVGGSLVMELAHRRGAQILPVDSEHSAIFQCLQGQEESALEHILLTASGGPFFGHSRAEMETVSREDALAHPRWQMGNKISIDSATLMNKGLEIIEAHYLFDLAYNEIEVVVHPQSIVHSLVRFSDGSILAQLGLPSMKLPIAYALDFPHRRPVEMPRLDLVRESRLDFAAPDLDAFPCLRLAREAGERGGGAPIALNAANEVAVAAFLAGHIGFMGIPATVAETISSMEDNLPRHLAGLDEIEEIDAEARVRAEALTG